MNKRDKSFLVLRNSDGLGLGHGQSHMNRIGNISYEFGYSEDGIGLGYGQSPKAKAKRIGHGVVAGLCKNLYTVISNKKPDNEKLLNRMVEEIDNAIIGHFGPFIVNNKRAKDNVIFQDDLTYKGKFIIVMPGDYYRVDTIPGYYYPYEDKIYVNKDTKLHSEKIFLEAVFCHEALHFYTDKNFSMLTLKPCKITAKQLIDGVTEYFSHELLEVLGIGTGLGILRTVSGHTPVDHCYMYETRWVESVIIKKTENSEKQLKAFFEGDYDNSIGREIILKRAYFQGDYDSINKIKAIVENSTRILNDNSPVEIRVLEITAPKPKQQR